MTSSPISFRSRRRMFRVQPKVAVSAGLLLGASLASLLAPTAAQDFFPAGNPFVIPPSTPIEGQPLTFDNGFVQSQSIAEQASPENLPYYNMKLGPVYATISAGTTFSYTSNYNLVDNSSKAAAESNFTIGPSVGLGLLWQPTATTSLQLNVGMSYQWSLNNQISRFSLSPNTSLHYGFSIGEVRFSLYNTTSTGSSATLDPVISGTGSSSLGDFNRLSNTVGMGASWSPVKDTSISGGYGFGISRGLNGDSYNSLNNNSHNFNLAVNQTLNEIWTVGIAGTGNIVNYLPVTVVTLDADGKPVVENRPVQNDSTGWSVGPTVRCRVSPFITASGQVSYQVVNYQQDGTITDTSNFSGITFNLSLSHTINENVNQNFSGGRSVNGGTGSNFTESYNFNYSLSWDLIPAMPLNFSFRFSDFQQSGPGYAYVPFSLDGDFPPGSYLIESGDGFVVAIPADNAQSGQQYRFSIGTGYKFTSKLRASLTYSYVVKSTDTQTVLVDGSTVNFGGYGQNTVVLSLAYRF